MKILLFMLIMIFPSIFNHVVCQQWKIEWEKQFECNSAILFRDVVEVPGKEFLILGAIDKKGDRESDLWLIRVGATGDTLWSRTYRNEGRDLPARITPVPGKGYILAGVNEKTDQSKSGFLIRVDRNGKEIWRKNQGASSGYSRSDVAADSTGFLWWLLNESGPDSVPGIALLKLKPGGEPEERFFFSEATPLFGHVIRLLKDGSITICGKVVRDTTGCSDIWMTRLLQTGEIVWKTIIPLPIRISWPECICCTPGENLLLTGWQGTCMNPDATPENRIYDFDMILIQIDQEGKVVWKRDFNREGSEGGNAMAIQQNGKILLAGKCSSSYSGTIGPWLVLADESGKLIREEVSRFRFNGDEASAIINTSDGGFLIIGPGRLNSNLKSSVGWIKKYAFLP
jgi:hypothetical protein